MIPAVPKDPSVYGFVTASAPCSPVEATCGARRSAKNTGRSGSVSGHLRYSDHAPAEIGHRGAGSRPSRKWRCLRHCVCSGVCRVCGAAQIRCQEPCLRSKSSGRCRWHRRWSHLQLADLGQKPIELAINGVFPIAPGPAGRSSHSEYEGQGHFLLLRVLRILYEHRMMGRPSRRSLCAQRFARLDGDQGFP